MLPLRRLPAVLGLALTVLLTGAGCTLSPPLTPGTTVASGSAAPGQAPAQLRTLTVATAGSMAGYSRDRFPHWRELKGGCDTRDVVLKTQGRNVDVNSSCTILSGTWYSAYDGRTITSPHVLDIDHVVPLANAWRSGAAKWTDKLRGDFANDIVRPQLLAVSATQNRSKGDQDPSQWKPPNRAYWCEYAKRWIAVKSFYHLTVTAPEKAALGDMLGTCAGAP
jgi:hypothetical protein